MSREESQGSIAVDRPTSKRKAYLDNIKGFLIVCVVFGHVAIPVQTSTQSLAFAYKTVYLFHMPLFVFVSGYLSKGITRRGLRVDKICSMIVLAFVYRIVLQMTESQLTLGFFTKKILDFGGAPWYLLSLATWYMLVPLFERVKPLAALSVTALLALAVGAYSQIGSVLSLSRTLVFLPYFLLGYYCNEETLERIRGSKTMRLVSLGLTILLVSYLFLTKYGAFADSYYLVYGAASYKNGIRDGVMYRALFSMMACIIGLSIVCNAPSRRLPVLARLGESTLQIYVVHRLLRSSVAALGIYDLPIMSVEPLGLAIVLLVTVVLTAISMLPIWAIPLNWIMNESGKPFVRKAVGA